MDDRDIKERGQSFLACANMLKQSRDQAKAAQPL